MGKAITVSNSKGAFLVQSVFTNWLTVERSIELVKNHVLPLYLARANDLLLLVIYQNKQLTIYPLVKARTFDIEIPCLE